jgi:hypothetical protein
MPWLRRLEAGLSPLLKVLRDKGTEAVGLQIGSRGGPYEESNGSPGSVDFFGLDLSLCSVKLCR